MLEDIEKYCIGYVATPIIEAFQRHGVFKLLDCQEFRPRTWLTQQLRANEGYLAIALQYLTSIGWLERNLDDAFRLADGMPLDSTQRNDTALYEFGPVDLITNGLHTEWLGNRIREFIEMRRMPAGDGAHFLQGPILIPIVAALSQIRRDRPADVLEPDKLQLSADIRCVIAEMGWMTSDAENWTATGLAVLGNGLIQTIAYYRPLLYDADQLLFGDTSLSSGRAFHRSSAGVYQLLADLTGNNDGADFVEDFARKILEAIENPATEIRPRAVVELAAGDGTLLAKALEVARQRAKRTERIELVNQAQLREPSEPPGVDRDSSLLLVVCFPEHECEPGPIRPEYAPLNVLARDHPGCCVDRQGRLVDTLAVLGSWQRRLIEWSESIGTSRLMVVVAHSASLGGSRPDGQPPASAYIDLIMGFLHRHLITAEAFLILAARAGLFDESMECFDRSACARRVSFHELAKRDYLVRHASSADYEALEELEGLCWRHSRSSSQRIRSRVEAYPQGQFVLEKNGVVLGVVYSQRINDIGMLDDCTAENVHELHDVSGSIVQLLAVNVHPNEQNHGYGDELLEFMLQRCSRIHGVDHVVGVTLCKRYEESGAGEFDTYVHRMGIDADPIMAFHRSHGAKIVKAMANYRPEDRANKGFGVLVAYDLQHRSEQMRCYRGTRSSAVDSTEWDGSRDHIGHFVQQCVSRLLGSKGRSFDTDRPLMEMGLDSADLLTLQGQLEFNFSRKLQSGFFFEFNSTDKVIRHLAASSSTAQPARLESHTDHMNRPVRFKPGDRASDGGNFAAAASASDMAIIGMACKLPGGIEMPEQLWQVLTAERCVVQSYPSKRGPWPSGVGRPGIDHGGFVDDADSFDASFFRISPAEALVTDPQQRILLELAWAAFEDAGVSPRSLKGSKTGVFVGASNSDYSRLLQDAGTEIEAHSGIGSSLAVLANRLSYFFDLSGPSMLIDTACSSSLVALHTAMQFLRSGECRMALVGGVNLICHPDLSLAYHKAGMLSPEGRCNVFDAKANGYVRSEGGIVFLLKPLHVAIADRDPVHAVIKGSAINHGGLAAGLTVPNPQKQCELLMSAWANAGVEAAQLSYIEAHGTGTPLGDPIEIQGILAALAGCKSVRSKSCGVGSLKGNLGHLESAAGVAGLLKVILSMKHGQIPASINFETINPKIPVDGSPLFIQATLERWRGERPLSAGVSSFGSAGANAHVVVQEFIVDSRSAVERQDGLFVLSANTRERLRAYAEKTLSWMEMADLGHHFRDALYTWQVGRLPMKCRLAIRARDSSHLQNSLRGWLQLGRESPGVWYGETDEGTAATTRLWLTASGRELIARALRSWDLEQVAIIWTAGVDVEWEMLYDAIAAETSKPRRVGLPTYPFQKDRFWVDRRAIKRTGMKPSIGPLSPPLLSSNSLDAIPNSFESAFSGEEFFLTDHGLRLDGREEVKILPGVAYLEMIRAAIERAQVRRSEDTVLELRNVVWLRPLGAGEYGRITTQLIEGGGAGIEFKIASRDAHDNRVEHFEGSAVFNRAGATPVLDLNQLKGEMQRSVQVPSALYEMFSKLGIIYGAAFRSITVLNEGDGQLLAQLRLPSVVAATIDQFTLHPSILDGALQSCIFLLADLPNLSAHQPSLPFSIDHVRVLAACGQEMSAWIRFSHDSSSNAGRVAKLDVDICSPVGVVAVQLRGLSFRELKADSLASHGAVDVGARRSDGTSVLRYLLPVWNPVQRMPPAVSADITVTILGDNDTSLSWVKKSFSGARFLRVSRDDGIERIQETLRGKPIERLLWLAPDVRRGVDARDECAEGIANNQDRGVLAVFRIVKALINLGYGNRELEWTVIIGNTQQVSASDVLQPAHSGVLGLIGALAKEYPQWTLRLLDVDSLESVSALDCLSWMPGEHRCVRAIRRGEWFSRAFALYSPAREPEPIYYKQGGTYVVIGGAGGIGELWSRFMIEHYEARLVWIGRNKADATINAKIDSLGRVGIRPLYFVADATDFHALQAAAAAIGEKYPSVNGVVHSALVLRDQSLALMDETTFTASLSAKVDISVNIDRVFGARSLDFMLFFSSVVAFINPPGQSNYAAGCTFKDSFAAWLERRRPYPIKVVNWGYWGKVGVVADEAHGRIMERMGIGSIEADEGMRALQMLIGSDLDQLAVLRTVGGEDLDDLPISDTVTHLPGRWLRASSNTRQNVSTQIPIRRPIIADGGLQSPLLDHHLADMLLSSLISVGIIDDANTGRGALSSQTRPVAAHQRWLDVSIRYLRQRRFIQDDHTAVRRVPPMVDLWRQWNRTKADWKSNPNLVAQVRLAEACLRALPNVLFGRELSTDAIFPNASLDLVEGIYHGNSVSDYFNKVLTDVATICMQQTLEADSTRKMRILEIGAGTGGTTAELLPVLQGFPIDQYAYTDISKAFLLHADASFKAQFPALATAVFDVSRPLSVQAIPTGSYDLAIATNVLHATPDIRQSIRNAKAVLTGQGFLILNEISDWSLFSHLTFGLLDGWWGYSDAALRIEGCPALSAQKWEQVLIDEGFQDIEFPAAHSHQYGQQIIVARSDGRVRQRTLKIAAPVTGNSRSHQPRDASRPVRQLPNHASNLSLREKSIAYFQRLVAATLKMDPQDIPPGVSFEHFGIDSILIGQLTYKLRKAFPGVTSTLFFEYQNIDALVDHFIRDRNAELSSIVEIAAPQPELPNTMPSMAEAATAPMKEAKEWKDEDRADGRARNQRTRPRTAEVAIIGMSGRYPQADDLGQFWKNLTLGRNCISEIPADRWDWKQYFDKSKGVPGKIYTKWGGFLQGIDCFDPTFFKISPREAKKMDPQERLFLECAYHAIEDAGYVPGLLCDAGMVGVFVGVMNSRYTRQPFHYSIANRVSYCLNFQAPSMAIDTACSSSLTAVHLAVESINSGLSSCAIAGGVNLIIDPAHYMELAEMTMLSAGGECRAFGENADGFVDAEGVGAVVLKPLDAARRDGDHIYGVIKGSAINAGGKTNGYTVPNPKAQAAVIASALERSDIAADQLSYVEAHGTGTALGDPIEIAALTRAFGETGGVRQFCAIGSLKSNIGHCESAAGIAGLTKVLLQLKNALLVPTLHAGIVNSEIDFSNTPFRLQNCLEPWRRPLREINGQTQEVPRIAGISSFGAGGSNAHLIVREYAPPIDVEQSNPMGTVRKVIVPLSARTSAQLERKAQDLSRYLRFENDARPVASDIRPDGDVDVVSIAYTLQIGREEMDERLALVVDSTCDLMEKLQFYLNSGSTAPDCLRGSIGKNRTIGKFIDESPSRVFDKTNGAFPENIENIARAWVNGIAVDWRRFYGEKRPRRVSLPVYPFAKERYWIDRNESRSLVEPDCRSEVLHPLVQRNTSDGNQQSYRSRIFKQEKLLTESLWEGKRVLPAAVYLEMARIALAQSATTDRNWRELQLADVVWGPELVVDHDIEVSIAIFASGSAKRSFEIYCLDGGNDVVHCQGHALEGVSPAHVPVIIKEIEARHDDGVWDADQVKGKLANSGVACDRSICRIENLRRGTDQGLALLNASSLVDAERDEYLRVPALIEAALQAARVIAVEWTVDAIIQLQPVALESISFLAQCPTRLYAWIRRMPTGGAESRVVDMDIDLLDPQGRLCIKMHGVSYRAIGGNMSSHAKAVPAHIETQSPNVEAQSELPRFALLTEQWRHTLVPCRTKKPDEILLMTAASELPPVAGGVRRRGNVALEPLIASKLATDVPTTVRHGSESPAVWTRAYGDGVTSIRIEAAAGNALSNGLIAELVHVLNSLRASTSIKVLVIEGTDRYFLSGDRTQFNESIERKLFYSIASFPYPVIANMGGEATGAGFMAGALCDFMICAVEANYRYFDPMAADYLSPIELTILNTRFGEARTRDFLMAPQAVTGKQLRDMGWTCRIVSRDQVQRCGLELAQKLVAKPRDALCLLKGHLARHLVEGVSRLRRCDGDIPSNGRISERVDEGVRSLED